VTASAATSRGDSLTASPLLPSLLNLLSTLSSGPSSSSHRSDPSHSSSLNSLQSRCSSASLSGKPSQESGPTSSPSCDNSTLDHESLLLGFLDRLPPHSEVLNSAGIRPESPRETGTVPALASGDSDPVLSAPLHYCNPSLADDLQSSHSDHSCASDAHNSDSVSSSVALTKHSDSESMSVSGISPPSVVVASLIPVLSFGNMDPSNSYTPHMNYSLVTCCTLLAHSDQTSSMCSPLSHNDSTSSEHSQSSVTDNNRSPAGHGNTSGGHSSPSD